MARFDGRGAELRGVHAERLQGFERLQPDRLVRIAERLHADRTRRSIQSCIGRRQGHDAGQRGLAHADDRRQVRLLRPRALLADQPDVSAQRELPKCARVPSRFGRGGGGEGRDFLRKPLGVHRPRQVPRRLLLDFQMLEERDGACDCLARAERQQDRDRTHHLGGNLPRPGQIVFAIVEQLDDELGEFVRLSKALERPRRRQTDARHSRRQADQRSFGGGPDVHQLAQHHHQQRGVAQRVGGFVEHGRKLFVPRRLQNAGGGKQFPRGEQFFRFHAEDDRRRLRIAGIRQTKRGPILHLRIGVLERFTQDLGGAGLGHADERLDRGLAQIGALVAQKRRNGRLRRRIAEVPQSLRCADDQVGPIVHALRFGRLRRLHLSDEWLPRRRQAVLRQCHCRGDTNVKVLALERIGQRCPRVAVDQGLQRLETDRRFAIVERADQERLGRFARLLDEPVHRFEPHVGEARFQGVGKNLDLALLEFLDAERQSLVAQDLIRIAEERQQERPGPRLAHLGHHLGQGFPAHVHVDALQGEAQDLGRRADAGKVQHRLERLAANVGRCVVERAHKEMQRCFR